MARQAVGAFIYLLWGSKEARVIQSRPDTWANKALASSLDMTLNKQDDTTILWFDRGAEVISERGARG